MISFVSKKISYFFVQNEIIESENADVYQYSLEVVFSTLINFLAVALIAIFTKTVWITFFYLLGFLPLRVIAGGYHAKNHLNCFLLVILTYLLFLAVILFFPLVWGRVLLYTSLVVALVLVFWLAPVEDKNKPLSYEEFRSFRRKSRIAAVIYALLIVIMFYTITDVKFSLSLSLGCLLVALSLAASRIKTAINAYLR